MSILSSSFDKTISCWVQCTAILRTQVLVDFLGILIHHCTALFAWTFCFIHINRKGKAGSGESAQLPCAEKFHETIFETEGILITYIFLKGWLCLKGIYETYNILH